MRYFRLYVAIVVAFVGVIVTIVFWPEEKLTATLSDGTIVTLEKVELIDNRPTWVDHIRSFLSKNEKLDKFLREKLNWKDEQLIRNLSGGRDFDVMVEVSFSNPQLCRIISHNPHLWFSESGQCIASMKWAVSDEQSEYGWSYLVQEGKRPGHFRMEGLPDTDISRVYLRIQRLALGAEEEVCFSLKKSLKIPATHHGLLSSKGSGDAFQVSSMPCETGSLYGNVQARLETVPVDFLQTSGIRFFRNNHDVSSDVRILRREIEAYSPKKWRVWFEIMLRREAVPAKQRMDFKSIKAPQAGEFIEFKSTLTEEDVSSIYLVGPGVYFLREESY